MAVDVVRLKSVKFILLAGKAKYVVSLDNLTSPRIGTPSRSHLHMLQNKVDSPTAMRTSGTRVVHLKRLAVCCLSRRTRISNARVVKATRVVGLCILGRFRARNIILSRVVWGLNSSSSPTRPNIGMNCSLKRFEKLKDGILRREKDGHRDYTSHRSYEAAEECPTENDIEKSETNKSQEESETAGLGGSRSVQSHM